MVDLDSFDFANVDSGEEAEEIDDAREADATAQRGRWALGDLHNIV
ncbi:MAG: hypothetical protein ING69_12280 [Rhodocyclaceae bacterium]|jgi:hypothetical protein|nr:hypothetical protein [Rhodocyclaceae bacterium]